MSTQTTGDSLQQLLLWITVTHRLQRRYCYHDNCFPLLKYNVATTTERAKYLPHAVSHSSQGTAPYSDSSRPWYLEVSGGGHKCPLLLQTLIVVTTPVLIMHSQSRKIITVQANIKIMGMLINLIKTISNSRKLN